MDSVKGFGGKFGVQTDRVDQVSNSILYCSYSQWLSLYLQLKNSNTLNTAVVCSCCLKFSNKLKLIVVEINYCLKQRKKNLTRNWDELERKLAGDVKIWLLASLYSSIRIKSVECYRRRDLGVVCPVSLHELPGRIIGVLFRDCNSPCMEMLSSCRTELLNLARLEHVASAHC